MIINRKICPQGLKNNPNRPLKAINFITIHCTANYDCTATAKMHADYQYSGNGGTQASWHYTVDKEEIWQSFEDTSECWHAADGSNGPGNYTSIAIEICVNDRTGFGQACENAAWITAHLLKTHKLTVDVIKQHHDWYNKDCPYELRHGNWGVGWNEFLGMVSDKLTEPAQPVSEPQKVYKVGDVVNFKGGNHYISSDAPNPAGGKRKAGTASITAVNPIGKHPYHLIGKTSNVYGWVDKNTFS